MTVASVLPNARRPTTVPPMPVPLTVPSAPENRSRSSVLRAAQGPLDLPLLTVALLLLAFGLVMVYSSSAVFAARTYHNAQYFLLKQVQFAVVGLLGMTVCANLDYRVFRKFTYPMLGLTVLLLGAVIAGFGRSGGGAARWLVIGPVRLQPAELAKVAVVLWMAHSLSKKSEKIKTFSVGFLPHLLVTGFLVLLCLRQPDFGSSVVLVLLTFTLMFVAGAKTGYIFGSFLAAIPVVRHLILGTDYRRRRLEAFFDPWTHRRDIAYQLVESLMSFSSGGPTGLGLGDSRQKLFFLPEAHTDFIGAIVGEELGFVGICALLLGYGVLLWRGITVALRAADDYGTYVAFGLTTLFGLQVFINLGVATGILPTKGLTLPLVSYGGSALCINLVAIGILLSVSRAGNSARILAGDTVVE